MKINNFPSAVTALKEVSSARTDSLNTAADVTNTGSSKVALSPAALKLMNSDSDVNAERVAAIRSAIEKGEYKIDTSKIADGLIASARDLLK